MNSLNIFTSLWGCRLAGAEARLERHAEAVSTCNCIHAKEPARHPWLALMSTLAISEHSPLSNPPAPPTDAENPSALC